MVFYRYEHILAQTLYEPWFVLLRVLNLVQSNFGAVAGEPFDLLKLILFLD
jgi:hypothetical protein